jgi:hypothetical protein
MIRHISLLTLILITFTTNACKKPMKKYKWIPTECAPADYPSQIYNGFVFYGDGKSIYIPDGRPIDYGWGADGSINIAGEDFKEAPNRITVNWISYAENKSYSADFKLDEKKIDSLFNLGYRDDSNSIGRPTYDMVKIGLAPGGFVVVWLTGFATQIEVGHFTAEEVPGFDWKKRYSEINMTEYREHILTKIAPEAQRKITEGKIPFQYWNNLRNRYDWIINFNNTPGFMETIVEFINKEEQHIYKDEIPMLTYQHLAPPEHFYIEWLDHLKRKLGSDIWFDVAEMQSIFSRHADEKITINVAIDDNNNKPRITFKTGDKVIATPTIKTKTYYKRD